MSKIFAALLAVTGLGAGVGGGLMLRPQPIEIVAATAPCGDVAPLVAEPTKATPPENPNAAHDYVKLNNQFVVPVVKDGKISSLVVLSLSLEVETGQSEKVYQREPKLRDAFLRVLFDHANSGGFNGAFTNSAAMAALRSGLRESAKKTLGPMVSDVLIMDIVRQDA